MKRKKGATAEEYLRYAKKHFEDYDELVAEIEIEMNLESEMRKMRKEKNLTQTDLAKIMKTKQTNVSKLEKDISHAKLNTIIRYAAALGKTMNITFEDVVPQKSEKAIV